MGLKQRNWGYHFGFHRSWFISSANVPWCFDIILNTVFHSMPSNCRLKLTQNELYLNSGFIALYKSIVSLSLTSLLFSGSLDPTTCPALCTCIIIFLHCAINTPVFLCEANHMLSQTSMVASCLFCPRNTNMLSKHQALFWGFQNLVANCFLWFEERRNECRIGSCWSFPTAFEIAIIRATA